MSANASYNPKHFLISEWQAHQLMLQIYNLRGRCVPVFSAYSSRLILGNWRLWWKKKKKNVQIWGFHIRVCCTICSVFSVPRHNTCSMFQDSALGKFDKFLFLFYFFFFFLWIMKDSILTSIPRDFRSTRMVVYMQFIFIWWILKKIFFSLLWPNL